MIMISWIDDGEMVTDRFEDPVEALDFIQSLRALDASFAAQRVGS